MKLLRNIFNLFRETFAEWNEDKAPRLAAALSYYTAFSIAPVLIVVIGIASIAFGQDAVRGQLQNEIQGLIGSQAAGAIQDMLANTNYQSGGIIASVIGLVTLLLGAAGVFYQLKDALNTIWEIEPTSGGILRTVKAQFISFTMVLGIGFLLLVSLVLSAILTAANDWIAGMLPGADVLVQVLNFALSFGVITALFALIYKVLPDTSVRWGDVWIGAGVTALLFSIGKFLIGLYLGHSSVASSYGAAGSFVVLLVWIYYSAQIFLFGAEFTQVYARQHGSRTAVSPKQVKQAGIIAGTMSGAVAKQAAELQREPPLLYKPDVPMGTDKRPLARDYAGMVLALVTAFATFAAGILLGRERRPQ